MHFRTISVFAIFVSLSALADCPKEAMDKFQGLWTGTSRILNPELAASPAETVSGEYKFEKCERFSVNLEFSANGAKNPRVQAFKAEWNEEAKVWKLAGDFMDGVLRPIDGNTFIASFKTRFPTGAAFCDEMINISNTVPLQITRAISCAEKEEGGELKLFKLSREIKAN